VYGSPPVNTEKLKISGVKVSADGLKARIIVSNLRQYYIHTLTLDGLRSQDGFYSLVHPVAYYTLNQIPDGNKLSASEVSTKNSAAPANVPAKKTTTPKATTGKAPEAKGTAATVAKPASTVAAKAPTFKEVEGLLTKNTCLACHNQTKRQIGPPFAEIAKRKYSPEKIFQLIHNPQPQNWPGYSTEMPPMPQVTKAEALKIAGWINSLSK
jgi:cytochrome c551/c552